MDYPYLPKKNTTLSTSGTKSSIGSGNILSAAENLQDESFSVQPKELRQTPVKTPKVKLDLSALGAYKPITLQEQTAANYRVDPTKFTTQQRIENPDTSVDEEKVINDKLESYKKKYGDTYWGGVQTGVDGITKIIGRGLARGAANLGEGVFSAADLFRRKVLGGEDYTPEEEAINNQFLDKVEEKTSMGLEDNFRGFTPVDRAVGSLAEFIPAMLSAEATGGMSFAMNGAGTADKEIREAKKNGVEFKNGADDMYRVGKMITDYTLMKTLNSHVLFNKLPAAVRDDLAGQATVNAMKGLVDSGEAITAESIANAMKQQSVSIAKKIPEFLNKGAKAYRNTSLDLTALAYVDNELKKKANDVNESEAFQVQSPQEMSDTIGKILTEDAPIFAGLGMRQDIGMMFSKSPYKNMVIDAVKADRSPENVAKVIEDVGVLGAKQGWKPEEIENTQKQAIVIADAVSKLPEQFTPKQFDEGVDLITGRNEMQEALDVIKSNKTETDPALGEIKRSEEIALENKIDQSNDKLRELATGLKTKYTFDEEKGIYTKQIGKEKPVEITEERYNLEQTERSKPEAPQEVINTEVGGNTTVREKESEKAPNEVVEENVTPVEEVVVPETIQETIQSTKPIENEVEQVVPVQENVAQESVSPERTKEVLDKAEDDLKALKQVSNKTLKAEASLKRLTEAKNKGEITTKQFDELKTRFDDVLADSAPKIKAENLTPEEATQFENEFKNEELTTNDFIEHERRAIEQQAEPIAETVQPTGNDGGTNAKENTGSQRSQAEPTAETKGVSDKFTKLAYKNIQSEEISNTLNNIERETGRTLDASEKEYQKTKRLEAVAHGNEVVEEAKTEFGDDYANKLIDYLDKEKGISVENRSLITISLELDLERRILNEPENELTLNKQLKRVRDISTKQQRSAAIATGYGILRQIARVGYDVSQVTKEFFSSNQRESKNKLTKAVEADADAINKEAQTIETDAVDVLSPDIESAIAKGVEKQVNDIYEKLPTKRREAADKAIAALDKIQKKLRSKTYDASIGVPVAIIDAGITTIKAAIKAGVNIADAIELGINKIKETQKKWAKEDEFRKDMLDGFKEENIDTKAGTKRGNVKSDTEKLADAKENIRKRIEDLKQQIADKKVELKATSRLTDAELQSLQAEEAAYKREAMKYLTSESKAIVDERMKATAVKKLQNDLERLNDQIAKGEKEEREAKKDPIESPEINRLKGERKAALEVLEQLDPTPKIFVKEALIESGYGREITVTRKETNANGNVVERKEKTQTLDWKKLAGEEGSIDRMKENVEKVLKDKGYSDVEIDRLQNSFEKEYNDLRASVIEKGLKELETRNTEKPKTNTKTTAKRLAELYNYGLFEKNSDTYDYLMNNALGLNGIGQEAFFQAKVLAKSLSELYQSRSDGRVINEFGLNSAVNQINHQIEQLLSKVAWNESNGAFKAAKITQEYLSMAQRAILTTVKQLGDNTLSGYIERTFNKLTFAFEKNDTSALKEQRRDAGRNVLKDAIYNAGLDYGDISNPFLVKSATENYINNVSTSRKYHAVVSGILGRIYLEGMDGLNKANLTEKYFTRNLIKVLTDKNNPKRMGQDEAVQYVSENLTGQKFSDALVTAKEIIEKVNTLSGKKTLPENKEFTNRLAMDIVKEALVVGEKLTLDQIEASYRAGYTVAGLGMGHEANNFASRTVGLLNSYNEGKLKDAIKEKRWNEAAMLTFTSILSKNILNPFVGGASNWVTLTLQKAGVDAWSPLENFVKRRKLDLTTEKGIKDMEYALMSEAKAKSTAGRVFIGATVSLLAASAAISSGKDKDLAAWLKKNEWAKKYFNVISPPALSFLLALQDKKMGKFMQQILNQKVAAFDDGAKVVKSIEAATEGDLKKAGGYAGDVLGSKTSLPIIPYRFGRQVQNIYRGVTGQPQISPDYSTKSFWNSFYRDGFVNYLGLTPDAESDKPLTDAERKEKIKEAKQKIEETRKALQEKD